MKSIKRLSQDLLGQEILFFAKHKSVLWEFYCHKHKQLSFDVAPMYKVNLSDTLLENLVLHV